MMYFVHSVQTYATAGKTRKGALLQKVAMKFQSAVLSEEGLAVLIRSLHILVDAVNANYKGKPLKLSTGEGWICVKPANGIDDNHVFSISFKPQGKHYLGHNVHKEIHYTLSNADPDIDKVYLKGGAR